MKLFNLRLAAIAPWLWLGLFTIYSWGLFSNASMATEPSSKTVANPQNLAALQQAFTQAMTDWTVQKAEVKTKENYRGDTRYWLLTLQPKKAGNFVIRYTFERSQSGYSHANRIYQISVGEAGCKRVFYANRFYPDLCLGDQVLVPIEMNAQNLNYAFYNQSNLASGQSRPNLSPSTQQLSFNPKNLTNAAVSSLHYLGRNFETSSTRGGDLVVHWQSLVVAKRPGLLNIKLQLLPSPELEQLAAAGDGSDDRFGISLRETQFAIAITPENASVIALPFEEIADDNQLTGPYKGGGSIMRHQYPLKIVRLRVGDRVWLTYGDARIPNRKAWHQFVGEKIRQSTFEPLFNAELQISEHPFNPNQETLNDANGSFASNGVYFDDWLTP